MNKVVLRIKNATIRFDPLWAETNSVGEPTGRFGGGAEREIKVNDLPENLKNEILEACKKAVLDSEK